MSPKKPEEVARDELGQIRFVQKLSRGEWLILGSIILFGILNAILSILNILA